MIGRKPLITGLSGIFGAAAFAGFLTFLRPPPVPAPPQPVKTHAQNLVPAFSPAPRLHATGHTLAALGDMQDKLALAIPQWAGKSVLLLMPHDINDRPATGFSGEDDAMEQMEAALSEFGSAFRYDRYSVFSGNTLMGLHLSAANGFPTAFRGESYGHVNNAIITMPAPDKDPGTSYLELLSGLPSAYLSGFPAISNREWFAALLMHEVGHVRQRAFAQQTGSELVYMRDETDADYFMLSHYDELPGLGLPYNQRLPEVMQAARAIGTLRAPGQKFTERWNFQFPRHATNIAIDIEDGKAVSRDIAPPRQAAAILRINDLAYGLLSAARDGAMDIAKGRAIADRDPLLHYAAVRALSERGFFAQDQVAAGVAREFTDAFETFVPQARTAAHVNAFLPLPSALPAAFKPEALNRRNAERLKIMENAFQKFQPAPPLPPLF